MCVWVCSRIQWVGQDHILGEGQKSERRKGRKVNFVVIAPGGEMRGEGWDPGMNPKGKFFDEILHVLWKRPYTI